MTPTSFMGVDVGAQSGLKHMKEQYIHGLSAMHDDALLVRTSSMKADRVYKRMDSGYYRVSDGDPALRLDDMEASRVVETAILRLTFPIVHLVERSDGGALMLSADADALHRFVKGRFALCGLHGERAHLNGLRWNDLAPRMQNRIMDAAMVLSTILAPCPEAVQLDILAHTRTSLFQHRQRVRHMLHPGIAPGWIRDVARTETFLRATHHGFPQDSAADCEAVLRFCACFLQGIDAYERTNGDIDAFLASTLDIMNRETDSRALEGVAHALDRSMQNNMTVFGEQAFRRRQGASVVDMALFEVYAIIFAPLSTDFVREQRESFRRVFDVLMSNAAFVNAITHDPHHPDHVRLRFGLAISLHRDMIAAMDRASASAFERAVRRAHAGDAHRACVHARVFGSRSPG